MTPTVALPDGDGVHLAERLVVAPAAGVFRPHSPCVITTEGELVEAGTVIGFVDGPGRAEPVTSFFSGFLMAVLVETGQRVRPGQPIAWLHATDVAAA